MFEVYLLSSPIYHDFLEMYWWWHHGNSTDNRNYHFVHIPEVVYSVLLPRIHLALCNEDVIPRYQ